MRYKVALDHLTESRDKTALIGALAGGAAKVLGTGAAKMMGSGLSKSMFGAGLGAAGLGAGAAATGNTKGDQKDGIFTWKNMVYDNDKSFGRNMAGHAINLASIPLGLAGPMGWAGIGGLQAAKAGFDAMGGGQSTQGQIKSQGIQPVSDAPSMAQPFGKMASYGSGRLRFKKADIRKLIDTLGWDGAKRWASDNSGITSRARHAAKGVRSLLGEMDPTGASPRVKVDASSFTGFRDTPVGELVSAARRAASNISNAKNYRQNKLLNIGLPRSEAGTAYFDASRKGIEEESLRNIPAFVAAAKRSPGGEVRRRSTGGGSGVFDRNPIAGLRHLAGRAGLND